MARAIWQKTVTDNTGAPSNGAQVTVTIQGGGAATIFSAQSGGSARSNPFTTGSDGIARFYADRGYYNVSVFKDGSTVSFPWNNLGDKNLFDDLGTAGLANLTTSSTDATAGRVFKVGDNVGITFGSNANGSFTRFPDGTQIAHSILIGSTLTQTLNTGDTYIIPTAITLPSTFVSVESRIASFSGNSGIFQSTTGEGSLASIDWVGGINLRWAVRNIGTVNADRISTANVTTIGRWK